MAGLVAAGSGQASRAFPESGVKPVLQVPQRRHVAASGPRSDPHTRVVGSRLTSVKPGPDQRLGILPLPSAWPSSTVRTALVGKTSGLPSWGSCLL